MLATKLNIPTYNRRPSADDIAAMSPAEKKYLGCTQLTITTPTNPDYDGMVFGVKFNEGHALVNRSTPNRWGYTLEKIGAKFDTDLQGHHYEVNAEWLGADTRGPATIDPDPDPTADDEPIEPEDAEAPLARAALLKGKKARSAQGRAKVQE
jgi:hypothetical protein